MKSLFALDTFDLIYSKETVEKIKENSDCLGVFGKDILEKSPEILKQADIIFSGWGCPKIDKAFLDVAQNLKAVFYGAGSIRCLVSDEFWNRDIVVCSAGSANAIPVSEYCLSQILFGLKCGYQFINAYKTEKKHTVIPVRGLYGATVGIVSAGTIGKLVMKKLSEFDVNILVYEEYLSEEEAKEYNAKKATLEEIFSQSDVVSIHTADIPANHGLINGKLISMMKPYTTLLNSSRGVIINEPEMIDVLNKRDDIVAILDVTNPEPPREDSPLWNMDNVILTPHIAGSMVNECKRHGDFMFEEMMHYLNGEELKSAVSFERFQYMA